MADPLSIAASVAGLVTLAASTAKLAKTLSDRYNEKAAASIRGNVETLDSALIRINRSLEHQAFNHPGEEALRQPIESCARTLRNIEMQFQKLEIKGYSWQSMRERIARPEVLRDISTLQGMLEGQKTTLLIAMHYFIVWREHWLIMANRNCTGESQSKMLHMIFRAIEELRTTIDRERPVYTPFQNIGDGVLTNLMRADVDYASTPSVVHAHPSFDDWLSTWATPDGQDGQTSSTDESTKGERLNPESDIASSRPQNVKLIIEGLPQSTQEGTATREITTPANTPLYDIMFQLDKESLKPPERCLSDNLQGIDRICGLAIVENGIKLAPFMPWSTSFVVVTEGLSCYDVQCGLKINRDESLIHFYNECIRRRLNITGGGQPVVEKLQSSIAIRNTSVPERAASVTFQRTLRLPERSDQNPRQRSMSHHLMYEKAQGISEFLGPFPLFDTKTYGDRLPKEMEEKGGLFFPIFQREAFAFSFEDTSKGSKRALDDKDDQQFAIKVYSSSINCISGQQVTDSMPQEQDYIICPRQRRLDGFKSADNETRQFVAMPLGWEYSAEYQLINKEEIGGIQLQIAPRLRDCVEFRALDHLWNLGWSFRCSATASELGLAAGSVVAMSDFDPDIKLLNEFEHSFADRSRWQIHGRSNPLMYPMDETGLHRVTTVQDLLQRNGEQYLGQTSSIRLQPVLSVAFQLKFTIGNENAQSGELKFDTSFSCSPFLDFGLVVSKCLHDHKINCGHCEVCKSSKVFSSPPVWQFALLGKKPFIAGIPYIHPPPLIDSSTDELWSPHRQPAYSPDGWEMTLGAGARLLQEIHRGKELNWDWNNSCLVNIQLLNAAAFKSVTGIPAWTPISLLDYRKKGRLLQVPVVAESTGNYATQVAVRDLKSISTLDITLSDDVRYKRRIVTCPECETNMCNVAILPCKHIFCSDCVGSGSKRSCFQCDGRYTGQIIFSGAMESPFGKPANMVSSWALSTYELLKQLQCVPGYDIVQPPSRESPQTVAQKLSRLSWGDQTSFWFNFIISTLNKTDKRSRSSMATILAIEKARSSNIHQLESLLPLLSKADFLNEKDSDQTPLLELIGLSLKNVNSSGAQNHGCSPRASTCLEAVIDWMETESIGPGELLCCGMDLKPWLRSQKTPSLKCVTRFLKQGGRSFLRDYGFNREDLQLPASREVRELLLEDFISNGFDLNARDAQGRTILWTERQLTHMFLDNGARVDIPDYHGNTILHSLVQKQDPTSLQNNQGPLETLLHHEKGREAVNVRNRDGLTPYHLALGIDAIHYWDIYTRLLENAQADVKITFPKGVHRKELMYSLEKWRAGVASVGAFRRPAAEERISRAQLVISNSWSQDISSFNTTES
ncbi:hypothetical protein GCG54_00000247 [Colletotrichum gloeosporioides]|uniref:RING-type domain-containing protein n=1 Tax=Colletotrichum gloeosporioides TaxID=474922 RepID=A0A8H4FI29_COLGL|nr:uncharacterized protein GCG54_00000247 [Colletotrichum gloeosporioides]KAF3802880.1 hypothetical protein GCG54_00000247 [Colletotrichum gloeosporioides]